MVFFPKIMEINLSQHFPLTPALCLCLLISGVAAIFIAEGQGTGIEPSSLSQVAFSSYRHQLYIFYLPTKVNVHWTP